MLKIKFFSQGYGDDEKIYTIHRIPQHYTYYKAGAKKGLRKEKAELENQKEEYLKVIEDKNKEKIQIDNENEEIKAKINEYSSLNKDTAKKVDDLNFDITNLKISVSSFNESESSIDEMAEMLKNEIENQNKSIENKESQIEKINYEQKELENKINETNSKIAELKAKTLSSDEDIEKMR